MGYIVEGGDMKYRGFADDEYIMSMEGYIMTGRNYMQVVNMALLIECIMSVEGYILESGNYMEYVEL